MDEITPTPEAMPQPQALGTVADPQTTPVEFQQPNLINVFNPEGKLVAIPQQALEAAQLRGFQLASPDEATQYLKEEKFGTAGQQAITALEGLARGATFNLSTPVEISMGVNPESIAGRREVNPVTHGLAEVGGLAGSAFLAPEASAAKLLAGAGESASAAAGLGRIAEKTLKSGKVINEFAAPSTALAKIGSSAIRNATEAALWQSSDEVSKMLSNQADPKDFAESALANIGMAGVLGGVIGGGLASVPELWKVTAGPKLDEAVQIIKNKIEGLRVPVPEELGAAKEALGVELPPELVAAQNKTFAEHYRALKEDPGKAGIALRKTEDEVRQNISNQVLKTLGLEENELVRASQIDDFKSGKELSKEIQKSLDDKFGPQVARWEAIEAKLENTPLKAKNNLLADRLALLAEQDGWNMAESAVNPVYEKLMNRLSQSEFNTAQDLRNYVKNILNPMAQKDFTLASPIRKIRNEIEDTIIDAYNSASRGRGIKFSQEYDAAKADYAKIKADIGELMDVLKPPKFYGSGYKGLKAAMEDMKPETIVNRLTRGNDAGLLELLQNKFPEVAEKVRQYSVKDIFSKAVAKAGPGEVFDAAQLARSLEGTTPQFRQFVFPGGEPQFEAVRTMLQYMPKHQTSSTAHNLNQMLSGASAGAGFLTALLSGHNPVAGAVTGYLAKILGRDVPNHARLALLKFAGSDAPLNVPGIKAMADMIGHAARTEAVMTRLSKDVFKAEKVQLPSQLIPTEKERKQLEAHLEDLRVSPEKMLNAGNDVGHYLPDQTNHMVMVTQNAVNYLNQIRPNQDRQSPLDQVPQISKMAQAKYNRALDIAISPAIVLGNIQNGMINQDDMKHLQAMYPSLYKRMNQKLVNQMIDVVDQKKPISYKTKLGLSLFMGSPLDTTMKPQSILAAQPLPEAPQMPATGMDKLGKLGENYQTPAQRGEARHSKL